MEAATVLARCIATAGTAPADLDTAAADYQVAWKPELDAVSWISEKMLFENRLHTLRANLTMRLGCNVIGQAKRATVALSQVRTDAQRLGPLWW